MKTREEVADSFRNFLHRYKRPVGIYRRACEIIRDKRTYNQAELQEMSSIPGVVEFSIDYGGYYDERVYLCIVTDVDGHEVTEEILIHEDRNDPFDADRVLELADLDELEQRNKCIEELLEDQEKFNEIVDVLYSFMRSKELIEELKQVGDVSSDFINYMLALHASFSI